MSSDGAEKTALDPEAVSWPPVDGQTAAETLALGHALFTSVPLSRADAMKAAYVAIATLEALRAPSPCSAEFTKFQRSLHDA
jgi:hypothetical protein